MSSNERSLHSNNPLSSIAQAIINTAPFPKLRTAYLRAIAIVWRDEATNSDPLLQSQLMQASNGTLYDVDGTLEHSTSPSAGAVPVTVLQLLAGDLSGQASTRTSTGDPAKVLNYPFPAQLAFDFRDGRRPIWNTNLSYRPDQSPWSPGFWSPPPGAPTSAVDSFTVYLPQPPTDAVDKAWMLAQYSEHFPSILGKPMDETQAPPSFAEFGVILSNVLALVWDNEPAAKALVSGSNAKDALTTWLEVEYLWKHFELILKWHDPEESIDSAAPQYWKEFPATVITLGFPAFPAGEDAKPSVALAAYNATGGEYPFSCI